jgi:CheY-like chemotaxis protein
LTADRQTEFLLGRLRAMGLEIASPPAGASGARGRLPLSAVPFETLAEPLVAQAAHFYTLGHSLLKLFEPFPFFLLPPIDVASCETLEAIEAELRRAWGARHQDLVDARAWLARLGAPFEVSERGTRLELRLYGGAAETLSRDEILLPSVGALAGTGLASPGQRRHRPLRSLEQASELELRIAQSMERLASRPGPPGAREAERPEVREQARASVLLVMSGTAELTRAERALREAGLETFSTADPRRALELLHERSYGAALVDAHMPRTDGVELMMRLAEQPGMAALPVVILDDHETERVRAAAHGAGAAGYLVRPIEWSRVSEAVRELILHWAQRRFGRFSTRLAVSVESDPKAAAEIGDEVGRGGMRISSRREAPPGTRERYCIHLPGPLSPVRVDGEVVYRRRLAGSSLASLGVRFLRFAGDGEQRWIQMLESLSGSS